MTAAAVVVLVVATVGFIWSRGGLSDTAALHRSPEATLTFPGSLLLREGELHASSETSPTIKRQLATEAPMEDVVRYYAAALIAEGWKEGASDSAYVAYSERQVCGWNRDGVRFRLSFLKPTDYHERYPLDPPHATVYEVRLIQTPTESDGRACMMGIGQ